MPTLPDSLRTCTLNSHRLVAFNLVRRESSCVVFMILGRICLLHHSYLEHPFSSVIWSLTSFTSTLNLLVSGLLFSGSFKVTGSQVKPIDFFHWPSLRFLIYSQLDLEPITALHSQRLFIPTCICKSVPQPWSSFLKKSPRFSLVFS